MINLYTSIGVNTVKSVDGKKVRAMQLGMQTYSPSASESVLWYAGLFGIYTEDELKKIYEINAEQAHLADDISFEWYLHHLEELGFIASGQAETVKDALFDLLKDLFIVVPKGFPFAVKLGAFFSMLKNGRSFRTAAKVFHKKSHMGPELKILTAATKQQLSTAELICRLARDPDLERDLIDTVYAENIEQKDIAQMCAALPNCEKITAAVARLYIDSEIMFDKVSEHKVFT